MKKHNKEKVISIGEELFRTQGYHNTGTEDILKKSEYPRSSFYYHFKSKDGFAVQVLEQYGNNAQQFYKSILADKSKGSGIERLTMFIEAMINGAANRNFKSECLIQKFSIECAGINDELCLASENQLLKILNVLKVCIEEAQLKREIRGDIEAMELAELIHAQIYGGFVLSRLQKDPRIMRNNMAMILDYIKK